MSTVVDCTAYEPGNVVRAISGGSKMTVETVNGDRIGVCWFDDQHTFHRTFFDRHSLELVEV